MGIKVGSGMGIKTGPRIEIKVEPGAGIKVGPQEKNWEVEIKKLLFLIDAFKKLLASSLSFELISRRF